MAEYAFFLGSVSHDSRLAFLFCRFALLSGERRLRIFTSFAFFFAFAFAWINGCIAYMYYGQGGCNVNNLNLRVFLYFL